VENHTKEIDGQPFKVDMSEGYPYHRSMLTFALLSFFLTRAEATMTFNVQSMNTDELIADSRWWQIYNDTFSESIRTRPESIIKYNRLGSGTALRIVTHEIKSQTIGMATYLFLDHANAAYLMYFAVDPAWHRKGAGAQLLCFVKNAAAAHFRQLGKQSLGVVFEAELPELASTEDDRLVRKSRLSFYKKAGAGVLPGDYVMPPVHDGLPATPMYLLLLKDSGVSENVDAFSLFTLLSEAIYQK
jgi:hypothetical protein